MNWFKMIPVALVMAMMFVFGCGKKVIENQSATDENGSSATQTEPVMATAAQIPKAQVQLPQPESQTAFLARVVLFDFDSDMLTPEGQAALQKSAQWLNQNSDVETLYIEGHCDQRGTAAYNLALGERRAEVVKTFLIDLGVDGRRLETQSFGEEKPAVQGDNEDAWAQNRRANFIIKQPH